MKILSNTTRKNVLAFLLGPIFLLPAMMLGILVSAVFDPSADIRAALEAFYIYAFVGLIFFAYPMTLFLGLPAIHLLSRYKRLTLAYLLPISFFGAGIVTLITGSTLGGFLMFAYCSAAVGFGCWYVYRHA